MLGCVTAQNVQRRADASQIAQVLDERYKFFQYFFALEQSYSQQYHAVFNISEQFKLKVLLINVM